METTETPTTVENTRASTPKQVMDVATKVATWATIAILSFFVSTVLSLDKNYGIMAETVESGFAAQVETLKRIEKKQDENSRMIVSHESRLATIEANRFTDQDSRELLQAFSASVSGMDEKVQDLWKAIASINAKIPDEIPPAWFVSDVRRLEADIKAMKAATDLLREKLARYESSVK